MSILLAVVAVSVVIVVVLVAVVRFSWIGCKFWHELDCSGAVLAFAYHLA